MIHCSNNPRKRGHFGASTFVLFGTLFLVGFSRAIAAPPSAEQLALYEQGDEGSRVKLLIHLAKNGGPGQADWLLRKYPLQGAHAANRQLFIEGLILKAGGDYTGATKKFRSALAADPKLTLVRVELAQTLVTLEQDDSALYHLQQLSAEAPTENAANDLRSFMQKIDERSPFRKSFWIAAAPSSNVNNGSTEIDPAKPYLRPEKPKKAIGVSSGANIGYSKRLGNDFSLAVGAGANGTFYTMRTLSSFALNQSLEIRRLLQTGYLGIGLVTGQSMNVELVDLNSFSYGPRLSLVHAISNKTSISADATYEWRNANEDYISGSDGNALLLNGSLTHAFAQGFSVTGTFGYTDMDVELDTKSFESLSGGVSVHKELPYGVTADVLARLAHTQFDGAQSFRPAAELPIVTLDVREDWTTTASIKLTKRDLNILGFAPAINYTYSNTSSSVFLFNTDNHAIDLRFTKDF